MPEAGDEAPLVYPHPARERFHLLDKILSLDDEQQAVFDLPPPLLIVGSAGSGKTALALEKMKQAIGGVLYVSLSPYLVESARNLYYAHVYDNDSQQVDFFLLSRAAGKHPRSRRVRCEVTLRDVQR